MKRKPRAEDPLAMKDGIRRHGRGWQFRVNLGMQDALRCEECGKVFWMDRRTPSKCTKCGGALKQTEKPLQRAMTKSGYATEDEARAARDAVLGQPRNGGKVANAGKLTVGAWCDEWLAGLPKEADDPKRGLAPATLNGYHMHLARHVKPRLGNVPLRDLDGGTIQDHLAFLGREGGMYGQPLKPSTIAKVRAILHGCLADARGRGLLSVNPADFQGRRGKNAERGEKPEPEAWSPEQVGRFLTGTEGSREHALWLVAALTGARRGECLGLQWSDVDLEAGTLTIRRQLVPVGGAVVVSPTKTKTGTRPVELAPQTVAALRAWSLEQAVEGGSPDGFVFTSPKGKPVDPRWCSRLFKRAVVAVNEKLPESERLPVLGMHALRHSWASTAEEEHVAPKVKSEALGHANPSLTQTVYTNTFADARREAATKVAARYMGSSLTEH